MTGKKCSLICEFVKIHTPLHPLHNQTPAKFCMPFTSHPLYLLHPLYTLYLSYIPHPCAPQTNNTLIPLEPFMSPILLRPLVPLAPLIPLGHLISLTPLILFIPSTPLYPLYPLTITPFAPTMLVISLTPSHSSYPLYLWCLCSSCIPHIIPIHFTLHTSHFMHSHLHTERWLFVSTSLQILNFNQSLYCKLGILIIKVSKAKLHHVSKSCVSLIIMLKLTLNEPIINTNSKSLSLCLTPFHTPWQSKYPMLSSIIYPLIV